MNKKEALKIVIQEVEAHLVGMEGDEIYDEVREAIKVLEKKPKKRELTDQERVEFAGKQYRKYVANGYNWNF